MTIIESKDDPNRSKPFYISSWEFYKLVRELSDKLDELPPDRESDEERWNLIVRYFSKVEQKTAYQAWLKFG